MPTGSKYRVLEDQSLFDIALQQCGSIEAAYEIALANESKITSLTEPVPVGTILEIAASAGNTNTLVKEYYEINNIKVASANKQRYGLIDSEEFELMDSDAEILTSNEY